VFQHALVFLMIVAQAPMAPPRGVSLGDAARRIRADRKEQLAAQDEMLRHVLRVSGLEKQIDDFPKILSEAFNRQMPNLDPRFTEKYKQAVLASFTSAKIGSSFTDTFSRQMGYSALADVLPWLESPVGRKVTAAEDRDPDFVTNRRNRSDFAVRIQQEPPSANRVRLIKEMEIQLQSADHEAGIILTMMRALVSSIAPSDPRGAFAADLVRSPGFERGFREVLAPELEKSNALSDLYVYSTLSDAELEQYVQFLSSPPGQRMNRAIWSGFEHSLEAASVELGTRLAHLPPEQP
jgi:hypothetical protein